MLDEVRVVVTCDGFGLVMRAAVPLIGCWGISSCGRFRLKRFTAFYSQRSISLLEIDTL